MKAIVKQEPTSYSGIVTLTVLNKRGLAVEKKVIKNNGVNRLFALLCRFLNGSLTMGKPDSDAVQAIKSINEALPKFLAVGEGSDSTTTTMSSLQDEIVDQRFLLTTNGVVSYDSSGRPFTQFSCNIPYASVKGANLKEFGLFAGGIKDKQDMLARITIEPGLELEDGQSLLINWRIYFTNKGVETDEV